MKTTPEAFESTYALILRSEETQRSRFETLVFTLLIVSTVFAVSQFGRQAMTLPSPIVRTSPSFAVAQHRA